jgi:hypothetical protein
MGRFPLAGARRPRAPAEKSSPGSDTAVGRVGQSVEQVSGPESGVGIAAWSLRYMRREIRSHCISFPAQVPVFPQLPRIDIQWRIVLLYFIRGWSTQTIAVRYGMSRKRVMQLLKQWISQAIVSGYVDRIPSEAECTDPLVQ